MFTTRQLLFWGLCLLPCVACNGESSVDGGSDDVGEIEDPPLITGISFVDVTKKADLYRTHYYPPQNPTSLPCYGHESMVGGAAIGDYNQDGWLDIFVPRLYLKDLLFINKKDGSFDEVAGSAGVDSDAGSSAAAWADVDGDGDLDLIVTMLSKHPTLLYLNQGNGTFKEEGMKRGVTLEVSNAVICPMMTSPSFGDIDQDGDLDLHINAWYDTKLDNANWARVYRNDGNGHFEDVSQELGIEDMGWEAAFSSAFVDINNDSWMDLFLVADWNATALYLNNGDGTFSDTSEMAQVGLDDNGMGLAVGDYNNDDRLDFFVTSIGFSPHSTPYCDTFPCSGNKLYRGTSTIQFFDATENTGVTNGGWGWGAAFFDFDNDGDLDLGMTNGYELLVDNPGFQNTNERLWQNPGNDTTWPEVAVELGMKHALNGRGYFPFDFDNDGDLDVFITTGGGHPVLYENRGGNQRHWLKVRLKGTAPNTQGVGATIRLKVTPDAPSQRRDILASGGYMGNPPLEAHFGLGDYEQIHEIRVTWYPSRLETKIHSVKSNQTLSITSP